MSVIYGSAAGANVIFGKNNTGVAFGGGAVAGFDKDSIIAYYNFNNDTGALVNQATSDNGFDDGSGSTNDGTNGSGVTLDVTGIIQSAYDYDATENGYTDCGDDIISGTGDYSFNVWLYHDLESGNDSGLLGGTNQELAIYQASTDKYVGGLTPHLATTSTVEVNQWHMLSYTRSGTTSKLFFDGEEESTGTNSTSINSGSWHIGGVSGGGENWHGRIDELCIAERAFTADEITELYNDGDGLSLL